ncbi:MAG TPA: hypothetical protein PLO69_11105 [Gammaproteobacteria bacterium]|nr:hypothetical protein [Gammaproteobacteria bacterium]
MDETALQIVKAIEWERAKGQLRAVTAVAAHKRLVVSNRGEDVDAASATWAELNARIEAFISDIESHGLNE